MTLFLLFAVGMLGHDEWRVREAGQTLLLAVPDETVARDVRAGSDCPETRHRMMTVLRAAVTANIDSVLPDWCPIWPDVDFTCWLKYDEASDDILAKWNVGDRPLGYDFPLFVGFRERTRSRLIQYVILTGDWDYARNCVEGALLTERRRTLNAPERHLFVWWTLGFCHPHLVRIR